MIRNPKADPNGWSEPTFWKASNSKQGSPAASETITGINECGPVVIGEIMYHSRWHPDAEYIELVNVSQQQVTLYDAGKRCTWRLTDGGNGGLQFAFSGSYTLTLAAGKRLLLVKDRAVFNAIYGEPQDVDIYAWGEGSLGNSGEELVLYRPVSSNANDDVLVDQVRFSDGKHGGDFTGGHDPWPLTAGGMGKALGRVLLTGWGNHVDNWQAVDPTPGQP